MRESGIRLDALDEAASRLRHLGAWDNKLGDAFQIFIGQVRVLEQFAGIHQALDDEGRPSTIKTWDDFEKRMSVLFGSFIEAGARCHVNPADFILLARMSGHWREQGAAPPSVLRIAQFGMVVVEWEKPSCALMLDKGTQHPVGEESNFTKHNLFINRPKIEETIVVSPPKKSKRYRKPIRKVAQ